MICNEYKIINEKVYTHTLNNGMKLTLVKKEGFKGFFCGIIVKLGSCILDFMIDGKKDSFPTGIAHYLEHKLFCDENNNDLGTKFAEYGLESNAETSFKTTTYYFSGLDNLEKGIEILLDLVQNPKYTKESVEAEKEIIIQEIMMYRDYPDDRLYYGILNNLFEKYPIRNDIGGTVEDVKSITKEDLDKCHKLFYHPKNMEMVISGDINPQEIVDFIENIQKDKVFDEYKEITPIYYEENNIIKKQEIEMDINVHKVSIGFRINYNKTPISELNKTHDESLLWKLWYVFAFGTRTKFNQKLLDDEVTTEGLEYSHYIDDCTEYIILSADTNNPDLFIKRIMRRIKTLNNLKINEEIFEYEKRSIYGACVSLFDNIYKASSYILNSIENNNELFRRLNFIKDITIDKIMQKSAIIKNSPSSVFIIKPNSIN